MIGGRQIEELLNMAEAIGAVERAFKLKAEGKTKMPPKIYLDLLEFGGDFRAMPAYIDGAAGVKWVCAYPENPRRNLRTVVATIILSDPDTGYPLAIMDGTHITNLRTGAAGGVAVKYLSRKDSTIIGIIGAGVQARTQLMAIKEVLPRIKLVKAFDVRFSAAAEYSREMGQQLNLDVRVVPTIEEATDADIIVAVTPAREPIIMRQHVRPGTHLNAIGADAKGKQELDPEILKNARIVADDIEQASHSGEINVPVSAGIIKVEDIHATLGEVVAGMKPGRSNDREITVFDSTGLAIEDIICARLIYEKVKNKAGFTTMELSA